MKTPHQKLTPSVALKPESNCENNVVTFTKNTFDVVISKVAGEGPKVR